jgi:hypothetical protein
MTTWKWDTSHRISFYVNGCPKGSGTHTADTNSGAAAFRIGGSGYALDYFNGDMAEVLIYNAALSDTDRQKVEAFLSAKYNISVRTSSLNAAEHLTIPTYDTSGQADHPSIRDFGASPWNGYRYWMAMTPYPAADATKENPSIVASNDKTTWIVPVGLTNPIDPRPGTGYNSDAELVMSADGLTMYCVWREVVGASTADKIWIKSSTDGITWAGETDILDAAFTAVLSPTIEWDGTQFVMWSVNGTSSNALEKRTCATIDGVWSEVTTCTFINPSPSLFHVCVRKFGSTYYLTGMDTQSLYTKGSYLAWSTDGEAWEYDPGFIILPGASGAWDDTRMYRSTFAKVGNVLDIWYSAYNASNEWYTGYTQYALPA